MPIRRSLQIEQAGREADALRRRGLPSLRLSPIPAPERTLSGCCSSDSGVKSCSSESGIVIAVSMTYVLLREEAGLFLPVEELKSRISRSCGWERCGTQRGGGLGNRSCSGSPSSRLIFQAQSHQHTDIVMGCRDLEIGLARGPRARLTISVNVSLHNGQVNP